MAKAATAVADDKVLLKAVVSAVGVNRDIHDNNNKTRNSSSSSSSIKSTQTARVEEVVV